MKELKGACILGQSGGPTSVINASAAGVFIEALSQENITEVYGAVHGIKGILNEDFYDINKEDINELELLKTTPSSSIGSVRYKLKDYNVDNSEYYRLLEVFRKYNIRYFFYNGGNDSMDTCNKISKFFKQNDYDCNCIGVPKTIDNDLSGTDHCPGYPSAVKYVATSIMELYQDATVYDIPMITIVEIMGRNAGWLTAGAQLATYKGCGADLIYLPEVEFTVEKCVNDIKDVMKSKNKVIIAISEGVKNKEGKYLPEMVGELATDAFGHAQLGGAALVLSQQLKLHFDCKVRAIEFSLLQRCAAHLASEVDVNEAFNAGKKAVEAAVSGITDKMVCFNRTYDENNKYKCEYKLVDLDTAANTEKTVPLEWLNENQTGLTQDFIDYILPLIQGDLKAPLEDGLPRFARLNKIKVGKK